jgi:hypothetical protein
VLEDYVGWLLVAMVAGIVFVSWLTIDQEEFDRNFERYRKTEEED